MILRCVYTPEEIYVWTKMDLLHDLFERSVSDVLSLLDSIYVVLTKVFFSVAVLLCIRFNERAPEDEPYIG
jgi:hypothetical protein